jgi:hypothetical protein
MVLIESNKKLILNKTQPIGIVRFLTTRKSEHKHPICARYDKELYKKGIKVQTSEECDGVLSDIIVGYANGYIACEIPAKRMIALSDLNFTEDEILNSSDFKLMCLKGYLGIVDEKDH